MFSKRRGTRFQLRLGGGGGRLHHLAGGGRGAQHAGRAVRARWRTEFGWNRATVGAGGLDQSAPLRVRWSLRGHADDALRAAAGGRRRAADASPPGAFLTTQIREPWQLILLWGVVVGLGAGCMATVLAATVANRWFVARRGLVVGVLTAAGATGQLIFLPLLAWLAVDLRLASRLGDHGAGRAGGRPAGADLPARLAGGCGAAALRRDEGRSAARRRQRATRSPTPSAGLQFAAGQRDFWLLAIPFFICGLSTNGLIGTHLIPAGIDHGMAEIGRGGLAGPDRHLRHRRHHALRLADRPLGQPQAALRLLRVARALADAAAAGLLGRQLQHDRLHRLLRAGLGRHRAADRGPGHATASAASGA